MKFNKKKCLIRNVKFGKNVTIIEPVNLYGCEIKDNCFIGPFVEIQENVKIGKNTRSKVIALFVQMLLLEKIVLLDMVFVLLMTILKTKTREK